MFEVAGRIDQNGRRYIEVASGQKICRVPLDDFSSAPNEALKKINSAGILIINDQAKTYLKNKAQAISEWTDIYIADHRGWHNRNTIFVLNSEVVIGREADRQNIIIALDDDASVKWASAGTAAEWLVAARLMTGQSRPIFLAGFAFVPPVLSIIPGFLNIGIEVVGDPGLGKSTIAKWAGSIWGGDPTRLTGFFEPWNTTVNGLEPTIGLHSHALLGLDELNLLGSLADKAIQRQLESAVFRLCYGAQKAKYGVRTRSRSDRIGWISTSNIPISEVLAGFAPEVAAAAAQRLITIPAEVSEFGVFERLPSGVANSAALVQHLDRVTDQFFGTIILAFLMHLVPARRRDEALLRAWLEEQIQLFLKHAGVNLNDGPTVRVARIFGLIYAAGKLAQAYRVLPEEWQIGWAVMQCYRAHLAHRADRQPDRRTALDRIIDYARQHRRQLADLRVVGQVELDDASFDEAFGFLKGTTGSGLELLIPPVRMHRSFPDCVALMRELRDQGHARVERGEQPKLTTKAAIRRNKPLDRIYCIRIPSAVLS